MKAVATALVLIAGAAVVLWFGNTLNSWVLGGLIGGLAALLLSIPISLTLFSYLSRRHDARLRRVDIQEEATLARVYDYPDEPIRERRSYAAEEYVYQHDEMLSEEEAYYQAEEYYLQQEEYYHQIPSRTATARNLPVPSSQQLPVQSRFTNKLPTTQRRTYDLAPEQLYSNVPLIHHRDASERRTTTRRTHYPGFPGYEPGSFYSQQRAAALRAARMEAARQEDDVEVLPTSFSRRTPPIRRASRPLSERADRTLRSSQELTEQPPVPQYRYRRRIVDAAPSQDGLHRSLPAARGRAADQPFTGRADPQTDYLQDSYPQTGYLAHQFQLDEQRQRSEVTTDNLTRPLVRRAPYTYEDDALRQQLSQQINRPVVRRSSLFEAVDDEETEYK